MKSFVFAVLALLVLGVPALAEEVALKTQEQKIGYAIGIIMGRQMGPAAQFADKNALAQGIADAMDKKPLKLTDEEMQQTLQGLQTLMTEAQKKADASKGKFLEENKTKPGVQTTASGLQYKVVKEGTGKAPKAEDTVTVNYKGTLVSGEEFDSSYKRGEPATFPVNGVIKGWTEALQLMKEGAVYELYIPSDLAYGERGAGGMIGPNEPLIFQVELIKVDDTPAAKK